jgi:ABC-type dipeptide/oligopeptide/nickel transport system permease component
MLTYLARRVGWAVVVLLVVSMLTFLLGYLVPADPARVIAGPNAPQFVVDQIRRQLGLDDPLYVQYLRFLGHAVTGDFGRSYINQEEVLPTILQRFPYTAELAVAGLVVETLIGVSLGIVAAVRRRTWWEGVSVGVVLLGLAVPSFWLGLILLYLLGYVWPIFPLGGAHGLASLVLPAFAVGVPGAAAYVRVTRSSMLEVLHDDYIRTARAKGVSEATVIVRHALRVALKPVVTMLGLDLGYFLGGVLVVEQVFGWPGIGTLAWQAILNDDLPMIMGTVMFAALLIVIANIAIDIAYMLVDPRVNLTRPTYA